ncbi:hypothetical protein ACWC4D_14415 [Streptomyces sp. NPDC001288]|uniref:hypothetical protein n=1 Tax=unclassified Streptomyces TaxID=2593676 RepID=UPI003325CF9B
MRHTCASLLHERRADARMIMEVLSHSSIRVTMEHLHLRPARLPALHLRPRRRRAEG